MLIVGLALIVIANVIDRARAEPLERPRYHDPYRDIRPPNVACPNQQTIDEVEALRRLGDREGEAISQSCGHGRGRSRDKNAGASRQKPAARALVGAGFCF
jgi:hypothetical protein